MSDIKDQIESFRENGEQWKLEGICKECRRYNYCSKDCTAHKRSSQMMITGMITQAMDEVSGGAFSQIMSHSDRGKY